MEHWRERERGREGRGGREGREGCVRRGTDAGRKRYNVQYNVYVSIQLFGMHTKLPVTAVQREGLFEDIFYAHCA